MRTTEPLPPIAAIPVAPALTIRGLSKTFGDRVVLDGLDLDVAAGELVSLLGANGSGKSTALKCVVGLETPSAGVVQIEGAPVERRAAMVFQGIHLVPRRSVLDNVCAGALGRLTWRHSWSTWAVPNDVREEAMACLARVGLADRAHDRTGRLSGGQQQRVAIARALCQRAPVLLADEPVSALDPAAAEQVMTLLRSLTNDGIAVAAVLHQPDLARRHSDRIVGLMHGRIDFTGSPRDVTDDLIGQLYAADRGAA
ncbi:phosphonate ABC transporter ATP-binding protein [Aeromicrobium chenweiae]|uniref:Phosphonate ABC transporter n=1 Tax=Aeromicrobium chenweiae TaxID=2079793 RepID=A0A2S0WSB5_9ACTN|nr:ATP-binding cassette domain-containing protein [Aeromicrobium chenweiae]AWB94178.1 phosphonate ABC transporter [Aeromicrobium chenweiae]TGN34559.1 ATP-binding cassette domain-containing protein [Aeromicrobium chenweiae]